MTRCFEGHHPFCIPGYWTHSASVAQSEWDMMARLTQWLGIEDGDRIIEMGCGGGGLTVYWGRRFPRSSIVAVTQTPAQTAHVMQRCQDAGLPNITVVQGPHTDWYDGHLADRLLLHPTQGYPAHDPATYHALRPLIRSGGTLVAHAITHPTHFYSIEDPQVAPVLGYWIPQGVIAPHPSLMVPHDGYEWSQTERWGGHHIRCSARAWQQIAQTQDRVVSHHLLPSLWVLDAIGTNTTHSFGISIGRWQAI